MVQLPLFQPRTDWRPPNMTMLPSWKGAYRVAVDIETRDPELKKTGIGVRRNGYMIGVSFAVQYTPDEDLENVPAFYLPFAHEGGDNLEKEKVLAYLREQAAHFHGDIVGANLQYDLDYLMSAGVSFTPRFFRDVQIAEPVLDENQFSYSLQSIAERNGFEGKDHLHLEAAGRMYGLENLKADLWKLPARHVGPYAEVDARLPLRLIVRQEARIQVDDKADHRPGPALWNCYDLESQVLPVLVAMRRWGVRIDYDQLDRVEAMAIRQEEDALAEMSRLSGFSVTREDINKKSLIAKVIEASTGAKLPKTKGGKSGKPGVASVSKEALAGLKHPVVDFYKRAARFNKLRTTYVKQMRTHAIKGRVHCTFNQLRREKDGEDGGDEAGAVSGRLSAADPSLQNQPTRDPETGPMWRACYLPDEGTEWGCLDYSQQEPRWIVHFAEIANCIGARAAAEKYRNDPKIDNHTAMQELLGWPGKDGRDRAKIIFLGICYGMGGAKLCREIGKPTKWILTSSDRHIEVAGDEGQAILDDFNHRLPFVRELASRCEKSAKKWGYVRTALGRRLHFPKFPDGRPGYDWTYKAGNRLIQGTSACQTKKAMVLCFEAGLLPQLQVHDELDRSFKDRDESSHMEEIMRTCVPCNVPIKVDAEFGPNWGSLK